MNKLLIFIPLLLLFFLIPIGLGYDFNFDYNKTIINNDLSDRIYAYNYPIDETWFISYQTLTGNDNLYISNFNEELNTLLSTTSITSNGVNMKDSDCSFYDGNSTYGNTFKCISVSGTTTRNENSWWFKLDNLTRYFINSAQGTSGNYLYYPSVANTRLELWKQTSTSSDLKYTFTNIYGTNFVGDGTLDLPTSYENINDMQLRDCGGMYHVIINKDGSIFDLIYDYNRNYKNIYSFSITDWNISENDYGIWCDNNTNSLYVTMVNNTFDGGRISLQKWNTGVYTLTNVWSDILNQTEIEPTVNGTSGYIMAKPFLTKDRFGRLFLFYEFQIPSTNQLRVSAETYCYCGSWINTTSCSDNYIKQIRNCPFNCDIEEQYVYSTYCAKVYNQTQGIYEQKTKTYSDCISVDSGLVRPFDVGVLRKDVSIAIPLNCSSNVMTNSSFNLYVSASDSVFRTNKNNFIETICNPLTSCDKTTTYVCEDAYYSNLTWNKNSDSYISGDIAKASFIVEGYPCKVSSNFFGYEGWVKYGIIGSLCYSCDLNCGGHKCETVGLVDYSYVENPDCSVNASSRIECLNGCDLTSGTCGGATTTQQQTQDALNPTNWINALIHPNVNTKIMMGLGLSFGLGLIGLYFIGNTSNNSIIFSIGFGIGFIIFSFVGWIPIVFSIIIVFMIGMVGLLKFIK